MKLREWAATFGRAPGQHKMPNGPCAMFVAISPGQPGYNDLWGLEDYAVSAVGSGPTVWLVPKLPPVVAKVYFNLHKKVWSIMTKTPKGWRVTGHAARLVLRDVRFVVSQAGRERTVREGRKNVHAFAIGTIVDYEWGCTGRRIRYNHYKYTTFVDDAEQPVHNVDCAVLEGRSVQEYGLPF